LDSVKLLFAKISFFLIFSLSPQQLVFPFFNPERWAPARTASGLDNTESQKEDEKPTINSAECVHTSGSAVSPPRTGRPEAGSLKNGVEAQLSKFERSLGRSVIENALKSCANELPS
jgi:hypothetical protein